MGGLTSAVPNVPGRAPTPPSIVRPPLPGAHHASTAIAPGTIVRGAAAKVAKLAAALTLPLALPASPLNAATVAVPPVQFR